MPDSYDLRSIEGLDQPPCSCPRCVEPRPILRQLTLGVTSIGVFTAFFLGGIGCSTRSSTPTVAPDSTLVYSSKIPGDVQVTISFALKGSKKRGDRNKSEKSKKGSRDTWETPADTPTATTGGPDKNGSSSATKEPANVTLPVCDRFELEEGARVRASIRIENPYGRGTRPLMFHMVWLNPERKRVFKKMVEWTPNESDRVLTTSLTIPPDRRTTGIYSLQVYLFRELIAEKGMELTGISTAGKEEDDDTSM